MAQLDEKTQKIVDREVAKAVKAETKRVLDVIKDAKADAGTIEDRGTKRAVTDALKAVTDNVKAA